MSDEISFRSIEPILIEHQSRVFEALAILELASETLQGGELGKEHQARIMNAVDGAVRILKDVSNLDDVNSVRSAAHAQENVDA